jgi:hypothetical protein
MDDLERADEIEGRLAEMEMAAGTMAPGGRALVYLSRELESLLAECRQHHERWSAVLERAQDLGERLRL